MSFVIERRVAVVTGGSSGIGLEAVRLLLAQGAKVAFCGRNSERLEAARAALADDFPEAEPLVMACDVLDEASCADFAAAVAERFGGADMLIANAGQGYVAHYDDTPKEAW